jgi:hypothetical protein
MTEYQGNVICSINYYVLKMNSESDGLEVGTNKQNLVFGPTALETLNDSDGTHNNLIRVVTYDQSTYTNTNNTLDISSNGTNSIGLSNLVLNKLTNITNSQTNIIKFIIYIINSMSITDDASSTLLNLLQDLTNITISYNNGFFTDSSGSNITANHALSISLSELNTP